MKSEIIFAVGRGMLYGTITGLLLIVLFLLFR